MSDGTMTRGIEPPAEAGGGAIGVEVAGPPLPATSSSTEHDPVHAALAEVRAELAETKRILDSLKHERASVTGPTPIPSGAMSPRIADSGASRLAAAARAALQSGDRGSLLTYLRLRRAAG